MFRKIESIWAVVLLTAVVAATSGCAASSLLAEDAASPTGTAAVAEAPDVVPVAYESEASSDIALLEASLVDLYDAAAPAVVYVGVPPTGSGSGFVYSADGYIVTNNHVVEGGDTYEIVFSNGERVFADLVGTDPDSDLAVLKVESLPEGVEPLPLATSVSPGQFAIAIGSPFGERGSMSLGIVSALGRSLSSHNVVGGSSYSLPSVIQTDAPINPGNSGGALLNLSGELIGVNTAIASSTGTNSGVGFAIPFEAVAKIVPALIEDGEVSYPYMGAAFDEEVSLGEQDVYGLTQTQGAYVVGVTPDSPAAQAGLIAADGTTGMGGDLIVAIDGQTVQNFQDLNRYLVYEAEPGQTVELTLLRGGETVTANLTLAARP